MGLTTAVWSALRPHVLTKECIMYVLNSAYNTTAASVLFATTRLIVTHNLWSKCCSLPGYASYPCSREECLQPLAMVVVVSHHTEVYHYCLIYIRYPTPLGICMSGDIPCLASELQKQTICCCDRKYFKKHLIISNRQWWLANDNIFIKVCSPFKRDWPSGKYRQKSITLNVSQTILFHIQS